MLPPRYYKSSAFCTHLVKHYIFLKNNNINETIRDKFIPDGHSAFVFNFTHSVSCRYKGKSYKLPRLFMTYPVLHYLEIEVPPLSDSMVIVLNSSVATRLFNLNLDKICSVPFIEIESNINYPLRAKLSGMKTDEKRIEEFENFLQKEVIKDNYVVDEIDLIYEKIVSDGGRANVQELLFNYQVNPRSFRRQFLKRIGVNAKALSRIVRVNYIWSQLKIGDKLSYQNIIYYHRFFDQSHFINDFKKIVGETPGSFFKRDLDYVKFISGKG